MGLLWNKSQQGDAEPLRSQVGSRVVSRREAIVSRTIANEELTEPQAHTVIIVDRSGSMTDYLREVNEQLELLRVAVQSHPLVSVRARIGINAFGDGVEWLQPFASALSWQPTQITVAWGGSPLFSSVQQAARACEQGRSEMRALGLDCFRHQMLIFSDFDATDSHLQAATVAELRALQALPANRGLSVHAVAFGKSVKDQIMRELTPNPPIRITSTTDISELFCWLLKSMTRVACSRVNDGAEFSTIQMLNDE